MLADITELLALGQTPQLQLYWGLYFVSKVSGNSVRGRFFVVTVRECAVGRSRRKEHDLDMVLS